MWMCLINQLHSASFDNLNKVGNGVRLLFESDLCQFLLHICTLTVVVFHFLQDKI